MTTIVREGIQVKVNEHARSKPVPLYQLISSAISARENCTKSNNGPWHNRWTQLLTDIESELPSGAGIDRGTKLDLEQSTPEKIVLICHYHHMNDAGMYDGWNEYRIIVTPSLQFDVSLRITGKDRNDIKSYLHEMYEYELTRLASYDETMSVFIQR